MLASLRKSSEIGASSRINEKIFFKQSPPNLTVED